MSRSRLHVLRDIEVGVERGRQLPPLRVCEDGNQRLGERAAERLQERGEGDEQVKVVAQTQETAHGADGDADGGLRELDGEREEDIVDVSVASEVLCERGMGETQRRGRRAGRDDAAACRRSRDGR